MSPSSPGGFGESWTVAVGAERVTAIVDTPAATDGTASAAAGDVFVCGHGAGGSMKDRQTVALAQALAARGLTVVRFNFPYAERGARMPDRMPKLVACTAAVAAHAREVLRPARMFLGGRSMGGRAATMLVADEGAHPSTCDALLLFAYPLHPAGQPEKLRDAHLPAIRVPVWCCNGTEDELCTRALMDAALAHVTTRWEQLWLDGADHALHVPAARRPPAFPSDAAVLAHVVERTLAFITSLPPSRR